MPPMDDIRIVAAEMKYPQRILDVARRVRFITEDIRKHLGTTSAGDLGGGGGRERRGRGGKESVDSIM